MPILTLNEYGWLPPGVHNCTLAEIKQRFGSFQKSDWRVQMFARLADYVHQAKQSGLVIEIFVAGSFTTNKAETE